MSEEEASFEQAFAQLQKVVGQLEQGGLDLEESVRLFEEGMALAKTCEHKLAEAELKVEQLIRTESGQAELAPFE